MATGMIDQLQRAARALQFLRVPAIVLGLVALATLLVLMLASPSREGDRLLIPSIVCLLWSLSTYAFITMFREVPEKSGKRSRFFARVRRAIVRAGYWLLAVVFVTTTLAVTWLSFRILTVWLKEYGG